MGPRLYVIHLKEDDPKKCTAIKLRRLGFVNFVISARGIILDPFSNIFISKEDRAIAESKGITAIDGSWKKLLSVGRIKFRGIRRSLPFLLASNPTNYAIGRKLSTAEAFAAALYILGWKEDSEKLMNVFKWGHTFFQLNSPALELYSRAKSPEEMKKFENLVLSAPGKFFKV